MAQKEILMPQLGESVTEGTVNSWLVKEGDYVNEYDPIADVMTDKVSAEVPSSYSGTIKELIVPEGETVKVGTLLAYIETESDDTSDEDETSEKIDKSENEQKKRSEERRVGKEGRKRRRR